MSTKKVREFSREYTLIQNAEDIEAVLRYADWSTDCGGFKFLLVRVKYGVYTEIWGVDEREPLSESTAFPLYPTA